MAGQERPYFEDFKEIGDRPTTVIRSSDRQPLNDIRVRIKVDKRQPISEGGLTVGMVLVNESQQDLTISNPLDSLQIILQDEEGWPVKMPSGGPPRVLINTRGDAPVDIVRPFMVEAIENSLEETGLKERQGDEKFFLKKNVTYEFRINVPMIQDSDKRAIAVNTTKTKQIEKGKYKLKVLFQLLLSNDSPENRQFESGEMDIELI
jgi:hypothetical protein